jgi:hypothetical protein
MVEGEARLFPPHHSSHGAGLGEIAFLVTGQLVLLNKFVFLRSFSHNEFDPILLHAICWIHMEIQN